MNARRHAPATQRNREVIAGVLRHELPANGLILEVASGSGEHVVHFAELFPALEWQPSDADALARESISAWQDEADLPNLHEPLDLNAAADWSLGHANAILCVNMVHISPWDATLGLLDGAAAILPVGGPLFLYGPYLRDAVDTTPSNIAFNIDLRSRNPAWGLRHLEAVDHAGIGADTTR